MNGLVITIERLLNIYFRAQTSWDPLISAFCLTGDNMMELINMGVEFGSYLTVYLASKRMSRERSNFYVADWVSRSKVIPGVEHLFLLTLDAFMESLAQGTMGRRARSEANNTLKKLESLSSDGRKKGIPFFSSGEQSQFTTRFRFAMNVIEVFLQSQLASGDGVRMNPSDSRDPRTGAAVNSKLKELSSKAKNSEYKSTIPSASMDSLVSFIRDTSLDNNTTINSYKIVISKIVSTLFSDKLELNILTQI